ncbi:MAG TPA: lysylphosphatidylglycerol synthase transmembrane domain-containing protein [Thermodesulfobacteriota bacterium]|nr:lysylphosphatidylglycerol synthase transmembrane domain-containing protein [Thermodesulfobacteriota bacterium]
MSQYGHTHAVTKKGGRKFLWLRIFLSVVLILFLLYTIDLGEIADIVSRCNFTYVLLAYFIALCDRVLMAYKWNILLKAKGIRIPLINITGTYLISTFLGLFLPATIGGDALRAYAVSKEGHSATNVISSIIIERALGFIALFIFVLISIVLSIFVFGQNFFEGIWKLFWLFLVLLVLSIFLIYFSFSESALNRLGFLFRWFERIHKYRIVQKLKEVYISYRSFQDDRTTLSIFLLLSLVENLFPLLWTYSLSLAFNIEVPLLYFFILIPIVLVLVRLPISFDGIGIQEGAFVYFLALIGVAKSEGLLLGISSHIIAVMSVLPGAVLYCVSGVNFRIPRYEGEGELSQISADLKKDVLSEK